MGFILPDRCLGDNTVSADLKRISASRQGDYVRFLLY